MKKLEIFSFCLVIAALLFVLIELGLLLQNTRKILVTSAAKFDALLVTANQTAIEARDASTQAKLAATEQRAYWQKTSLETYKTMASLRLTIVRTDRSINDDLVPRVSLALDNANELSTAAAGELQKTMDRLQPVLENLSRASAGAADTMNDPAIKEIFQHVDETSARAAITATETAQIADHLNDASRDFAAYVHRLTTPVRGTWNVLKQLLGLAAQARQAGGI